MGCLAFSMQTNATERLVTLIEGLMNNYNVFATAKQVDWNSNVLTNCNLEKHKQFIIYLSCRRRRQKYNHYLLICWWLFHQYNILYLRNSMVVKNLKFFSTAKDSFRLHHHTIQLYQLSITSLDVFDWYSW